MDWDSRPAVIFEKDVAELPNYQPRKTRVAQILENGKLRQSTMNPEEDEKQIKNWLKKIVTARETGNPSGVYIIFAGYDPKARSKKDPDEVRLEGLHPNHQLELPFSAPTFLEICKTFYVNTSIIRAISRPVAIFSRTHFYHDSLPGTQLTSYNILTHSSDPSYDLAMSVTTNPAKKQTYVIVYGCTHDDVEDYLNRLRQCGNAYQHPMLLPGIFAELQRIKHKDAVTANIAHLRGYVLNLGNDRLPKGHRGVNAAGDAVELWETVSSDKIVLETWKGMLGKMIEATEELDKKFYGEWKAEDGKVVVRDEITSGQGERIKERLGEIAGVYDELGRKCGSMIEGTTMANSTVWSRLAQRDSKQMKSIALLTMVFLPATFIASFFAMPLFEWHPQNGDKVVSTYIWIYVVVTVVLTVIVVLAWWIFSKNPRRRTKIRDEEDPYEDEDDEDETTAGTVTATGNSNALAVIPKGNANTTGNAKAAPAATTPVQATKANSTKSSEKTA